MSIWDNNFNSGSYEPTSQQPETFTPQDETIEETVDAEAHQDGQTVAPAATESTAASAESTVEKKTKRAGRGRKGKNGFPHLDAATVAKVQEMLDVLSDPHTAEAAKVLVGAKSDEPAKLIDELTDEKNREKVNGFVKMVDEFAYVDASDIKAQLVMAFMTDKDFATVLFAVLNAMAPDREFGSPTKDVMRNAKTISDKWGDGVDLSVLDKLKV